MDLVLRKTFLILITLCMFISKLTSGFIMREIKLKMPYGRLVGKRRQENYDIGQGA